jgi:LysR family transcriptional regulator, cell division regulator
VDASDLKVFEAVARLGSMNRAAIELNTVQSNVTTKIRQLELELGVQLFQRQARGVQLTPAGQRLSPFPRQMSKLVSDAKAAARSETAPSGRLEIGSLDTTASWQLPSILANFARSYPSVGLVVRTGTTASLTSDVLDCRLDSAFVSGPIEDSELEHFTVFQEELILAAPKSVRSLDALGTMQEVRTIAFRMDCSYKQRLDSFLAARGLTVNLPLEFGSTEAILGCIAAGVGISLLPKEIATPAWREGRVSLHELPAEEAVIEIDFIRRRDAYLSSAMSAFIKSMTNDRVTTLQAAE